MTIEFLFSVWLLRKMYKRKKPHFTKINLFLSFLSQKLLVLQPKGGFVFPYFDVKYYLHTWGLKQEKKFKIIIFSFRGNIIFSH